MFSKLSVVVVSALASLAVAIPSYGSPPPPVTPPTSNQCCKSVVPASSKSASIVAALLGLDLSGLLVDVGLSCSPITVLGNNCGGTTVVCDAPESEEGKARPDFLVYANDSLTDNLIAINCIPITL